MDKTILEKLADRCQAQKYLLTSAESCTGGLVSQMITSLAGSSKWFDAGFVTYSNQAKNTMLGVPLDLINKYGAVSLEVAAAMAVGALEKSQAHYSLAITGIAGPTGGSPEKPVGTVCFAWAYSDKIKTEKCLYTGDRDAIREQAAEYALQQLIEILG